MRTLTNVEVTSRKGIKGGPKVVVDIIDIEQAETLAELTQLLGSEEEVLKLANRQFATNAKNKVRATASGTLSETKLRSTAVDLVLEDNDNLLSIANAGVNAKARMDELVAAKVEELRAERAAAPETTTPEEDTEDE